MAPRKSSDPGAPADPKSPLIDLEAEEIETGKDRADSHAAADDEAAGTTPPAAEKAGRRAVPWLIGGAVLVGAIAAGAWLYKDYGSRIWPSDEMVALSDRVSAIESLNRTVGEQLVRLASSIDGLKAEGERLAAVAAGAQAAAGTAREQALKSGREADAVQGRISELESRVAEIGKDLQSMKSAVAAMPAGLGAATGPEEKAASGQIENLVARIAALEADVAALKSQGGDKDARMATLLSQSLADLKAKLAAGVGYEEELRRIASLVPAAPGIDKLEALAQSGIPTSAMLASEAKQIADELLPPAVSPPGEGDGGSYWDLITGTLGQLVTIRVVGVTDWRDIAARASEAAGEGNLQEAIDLIKGEGEMPNALRIWRDKAENRLRAEAALEDLSQAVLRQIAAIGSAP